MKASGSPAAAGLPAHWRAWVRASLVSVALLATTAASGCASPLRGDRRPEGRVAQEPLVELSEPAEPIPAAQQPPAVAAPNGDASTASATEASTVPERPADEAAVGGAAAAEPSPVTRLSDRTGDAGIQAPAYADIASVALDDVGGGLRITVDMAGDVPETLADGEVQGVGIDFFFGASPERSDYQVFLDGGSGPWRAYLQAPEGFVDFPGTFALGGRRLLVQIPWGAIGGRQPGAVSVFADWSQRAVALNRSSSDRVPDRGTTAFTI